MRLQTEFRELGMEESLVPLMEMNALHIAKFGPVDEALVQLARTRDAVLLTDDQELHGHCRSLEVQVLSVYDVLELVAS